MERQPWRLDPRGQRWFDVALVCALLLPLALFPFVGVDWAQTALGIGELAPLFSRRHHPFATATVVAAACMVQVLVIDTPIYAQIGVPVAVYSVARYSTPLLGLATLGAGFGGAALASYDWLRGYEQLDGSSFTAYFISLGVVVLASWALGTLARTRRAYVDALVERGERLQREAAQQTELAASDERARIAREMHDVVAHGLSVIVVQADGARYAAAKDPGAAETALETISATGREALTEMRKMLGLLRTGYDDGLQPQPGLGDLPFLIDEARAAGMAVEASLPGDVYGEVDGQVDGEVDGGLPDVADGVALTTYRVVQEALTNVRKHAGPGATVSVAVLVGDDVRVDVRDDGYGAATSDDGGGLGLQGMRERVIVHGGTLEAGPRPGGGYVVSARIPL